MKNKLLLTLALISMFIFIFVIAASAAAPDMYIEFGARFPGSDEYITVYTQNAETAGNPQINFATYKFYSDEEFTVEVDMSTVTGLDFSVAKTHGCNGNAPNRMKKPSSPFVNCEEVKWFLEGFPTVSYNGGFFNGWTSLKSFDFGNATAINDNTFENTGFEIITIPATIKKVHGSVFKDCQNLKSVKFEGTLDTLGVNTFYNCTALTDVDLGQVTVLSASMFQKCTALTSIEIPEGVTSIGSSAFNGSGIVAVTIPSGVTSIGNSAFNNCKSLTAIDIPSSVTSIGSDCFASCSSLATLTFGDDFSGSIGSSAFKSTAITSVTLPKGATSVGNSCFSSCKSLTTFVFKGDDVTLGTSIFNGCGNLTSIALPKNITRIPDSMFWGCGKVVISNASELTSLTTIGSCAFRDSATLVFTLPDTVTTIESEAFRSAFKTGGSFTINPTSRLTTIGSSAFNDCRKLSSIYIPSTVTSIGASAFLQCYALTTLENFENCQITVLEADTFKSASKITSIKIPETVTTINGAFYNNEKLALVYIPGSVTSIADTFTGTQPTNAVYVFTGKDASVLSTCARLSGAAVIPAGEYVATNTYTGVNLVVGYSNCVVYNNEVHGDTELTAILTSYYDVIDVISKCTICDMTEALYQIPALFTYRGYSVAEYGEAGIDIGYNVNREAVAKYESVTGEKLSYGVFAALEDNIGENDIFDTDGKAADGLISADMTGTEYSIFKIKMVGFADTQKDISFAMGAYVAAEQNGTTEYAYLQIGEPIEGEKYYFASYSDILKLVNEEDE